MNSLYINGCTPNEHYDYINIEYLGKGKIRFSYDYYATPGTGLSILVGNTKIRHLSAINAIKEKFEYSYMIDAKTEEDIEYIPTKYDRMIQLKFMAQAVENGVLQIHDTDSAIILHGIVNMINKIF